MEMPSGIPNKSFLHSERNPLVTSERNENDCGKEKITNVTSIGKTIENNDKVDNVRSILRNDPDLEQPKIKKKKDPTKLTTRLSIYSRNLNRNTVSHEPIYRTKQDTSNPNGSVRRNSLPEGPKHYEENSNKKEKRYPGMKFLKLPKPKSSARNINHRKLANSLTPEYQEKYYVVSESYCRNIKKVRSLPKNTLKSLVISDPKDFIHVASARSPSAVINGEYSVDGEASAEEWSNVVAEIFYNHFLSYQKSNTKNINDKPKALTENTSFLWTHKETHKLDDDIVTESVYDEIGNEKVNENSNLVQQDDYDSIINNNSSTTTSNHDISNNLYLSIDDTDLNERDIIYDDICFTYEKRVNSLYNKSTTPQDSEWEDLTEYFSNCSINNVVAGPKKIQQQSKEATLKRKSGRAKFNGIKKRRSLKSYQFNNKSSKDSTNLQVAVSLGKGSVLLIRGDEIVSEKDQEFLPRKTQGLVQIRIINLKEIVDVQETSCYVLEDENMYEVLNPCAEEDYSSTDSDWDTVKSSNENYDNNSCASNSPVPTSKNVNATRTVDRRKNILSKTWSLTKDRFDLIIKKTFKDDHSNKHFISNKYFKRKLYNYQSPITLSTFYCAVYNRNSVYINDHKNNDNANYNNAETNCDDSSETKEKPDSNIVQLRRDLSIQRSMVNEEPLYQIYTTKITEDYDQRSDDLQEYEQIDDQSSPAATKSECRALVKSCCRSLWSQTPQVIASGLLDKLNSEERKIQEAKFEILTSEASYLHSLRVLMKEYYEDEKLNNIITAKERKDIFSEVPNILSLSDKFLTELETVWQKDPMLNGFLDLFLKHSVTWEIPYINYCSNQIETDTALKELRDRTSGAFTNVISSIERRSTCQNLPFHSFLLLPLQRITRLPLLVDAVLSRLPPQHEERLLWEYLLSSLNEIVGKCNEGTRNSAQKAELAVLQKKLEYAPGIELIPFQERHLIKCGKITQLSTKTDLDYIITFKRKFLKTPVYLIILTDYILVAKLKTHGQTEKYTVIDVCKKNLVESEAIDKASFFNEANIMVLTLLENHRGRQVEYFLKCKSDTERQRWLEAVQTSKYNDIGETMYESWDCPQYVAIRPYTASQPDELSLLPGDVINVLRKTLDNWCHGEQLLSGEQGWFPVDYTREVVSEHVRARNLKQRHRFLALSKKPTIGRLISP